MTAMLPVLLLLLLLLVLVLPLLLLAPQGTGGRVRMAVVGTALVLAANKTRRGKRRSGWSDAAGATRAETS